MTTDRPFAGGSLMPMLNKEAVALIHFSIELLSAFRILFASVAPASMWKCFEGQCAPSIEENQHQNICQPGPAMLYLCFPILEKIILTDFRKENRLFVCEDRAVYAILTRQSNQCEFCI